MDPLSDSSHKPTVDVANGRGVPQDGVAGGVASGQGLPQDGSAGGVASGQGSPLFEEFSDNEEFVDHHMTSCATAESALPQASPASPGVCVCVCACRVLVIISVSPSDHDL